MKPTPTKQDEKQLTDILLEDAPNSMAVAGGVIESMVVKMLDLAWEKDVLQKHLKKYNVSFVQ